MRVAIVDDEPLARAGLRLRLEREPGVEIVGEAASGEAAVVLVRERAPELLFLDVRMPGGDGFETLARIALEQLPLVVFVTAYDAHAVRAFEVNALDYLLKPVDEARLAEALRRARAELARGDESRAAERVAGLLAGAESGEAAPLTRFVVRERGRFRLVRRALVTLVEPNEHGDYRVRLDDGTELPMSRRFREGLLGRD